MNIVLGTVLIFILLVPSIAFYIAFSFGNFPKATPKFTLIEGFLATASLSLLIHSIAILFIRQEIHFDLLIKLIGGELKDIERKYSNDILSKYVRQFAIYNASLLVIFALTGRLCRFIIQTRNIHFRYPFFRLYNRWWYVFNGYYLLENEDEKTKQFDIVYVDAVVDTKDCTIIYSGYLVEYVCKEETLERIFLGDVVRREFKKSEVKNDKVIPINQIGDAIEIPGEIFAIEYNKVTNLNLRFVDLDDTKEFIEHLPEFIENKEN